MEVGDGVEVEVEVGDGETNLAISRTLSARKSGNQEHRRCFHVHWHA